MYSLRPPCWAEINVLAFTKITLILGKAVPKLIAESDHTDFQSCQKIRKWLTSILQLLLSSQLLQNFSPFIHKMTQFRASLVAQWLGIRLTMQGTRVRALVWEGPTCRRATGPVSHGYWAARLEPVPRNKRGRDSERPTHHDEEWPPLATTRESPRTETKTQHSQK